MELSENPKFNFKTTTETAVPRFTTSAHGEQISEEGLFNYKNKCIPEGYYPFVTSTHGGKKMGKKQVRKRRRSSCTSKIEM